MAGRAVLVAGRAGQPGALEIHLARQIGHVVVVLRNRGRAEGVGLDQVGAGGQVLLMDVADHVGAGERQQLVVALDVMREVLEAVAHAARARVALAPVLGLPQLEALDHGAHGAVKNDEALGKDGGKLFGAGVLGQAHGQRL